MKLSKLDSDRSNYTMCHTYPLPKIGAFYLEANFSKLNPPINHKNIQKYLIFGLQTRELIRVRIKEEKRKRKKKNKKRKKEESSKGMDSSVILYKNYLGIDC